MNFLADESIDQPIVTALRDDGHVVIAIAELAPSISDDEVLADANQRGAVLLTADKDFGELLFRLGRAHHGVVLIRLAGLSSEAKTVLVRRAVEQHGADLNDAFAVVSPGHVRIRRSI
jgi:predicted nuclease of predicted toxin-antitoxin system